MAQVPYSPVPDVSPSDSPTPRVSEQTPEAAVGGATARPKISFPAPCTVEPRFSIAFAVAPPNAASGVCSLTRGVGESLGDTSGTGEYGTWAIMRYRS